MNTRTLLLCLLPSLALAAPGFAADQVLFDFEVGFNPANAVPADATVVAVKSSGGTALRVNTGQKQTWPGVALPALSGHWDLSPFAQVALDVKNAGSNRVTVNCRVDNPGANGTKNCVSGSITLNPGQRDTLKVMLKRENNDKLDGKLFGMRGYPVSAGGLGTIDPKNITQLLLFVNKPKEAHVFEVDDIRATGSHTPPTAWVSDAEPFFPFIDTFGQYKHKDWPGKVHSLAELKQRRATEMKELAAQPDPKDWDKYGGWTAGPQLQATGFFRTEKVSGKWWLVDPEGHLFFSHGIDCVRMIDTTPIEERAAWFEDFPGDKADFKEFLSRGYTLKGHYAGRSPQ